MRSFGSQRRDTLVATLRADGEGFAYFIEHRNQRTRTINRKKIVIDNGVKGMNIPEMHKWNKEFFKHAKSGDVLIMDNLGSHKNKGVIKELKSKGIIVRFIPVRCADVLSVLDNCFFAIFKQQWPDQLVYVNDISDKRDRAIMLFNSLVNEGIGKKMFEKCGYDDLFNNEPLEKETSNENKQMLKEDSNKENEE